MRARLIVRTWPEILDAAGLEVLVSAVLPQVFGEAFLMRNRKHIDRIAKAIVRRNPQDALAAHLLAMKDYPRLRSMLAKLEMPSLVISGSDDPLVSVDGAEEVAEKSGGRHLVAKGVGHSIAAERRNGFWRRFRGFWPTAGRICPRAYERTSRASAPGVDRTIKPLDNATMPPLWDECGRPAGGVVTTLP